MHALQIFTKWAADNRNLYAHHRLVDGNTAHKPNTLSGHRAAQQCCELLIVNGNLRY
jgi:hypothetical protein